MHTHTVSLVDNNMHDSYFNAMLVHIYTYVVCLALRLERKISVEILKSNVYDVSCLHNNYY